MNSIRYIGIGIILLLFGGIEGCGSSGGNGDDNSGATTDNVQHIVIHRSAAASKYQIHADQTETFTFTYHLPSSAQTFSSVEIDLSATLRHLTITSGLALVPQSFFSRVFAFLKQKESIAAENTTVEVLARIGNDAATVCTTGNLYGPFIISLGSLLQPTSVEPTKVSADASTLDIINIGSMSICVIISSPVDLTFSLNSVEANVAQKACDSPLNFAGDWMGNYQCGNSCTGEPFGGLIHLNVIQNGTSASYTDYIGDTFTGTICGNTFRFERSQAQEYERGTMTLNADGSATKRSTWRTTTEIPCGGNCIDNLTRG